MAQISAKKASQITVTFSFIWSLINLTNLSRERKSPERLFVRGAWLGTWLDTFILTSQTWFIVAWSWPVNKEDDSLVLQFLKKQKTKHNELGWASGCSCVRIVSQRGYVSARHSGNPQAKTISLFSVRENRKIQSSFSNNSFRLTNLQPCKHTYWLKNQILWPDSLPMFPQHYWFLILRDKKQSGFFQDLSLFNCDPHQDKNWMSCPYLLFARKCNQFLLITFR